MAKGRPRKGAQKEKVPQLNVHPPAGQLVRKTNQLVYLSRTIMHALIRHDESWPFLELLTPRKIDIPNYYDIITQPMSLRVVKKRLMNQYYWSADDAIQDISLVFENAYRVTDPNSVMSRMAANVESLFHAHLQAMPQPEVEIGINQTPAARSVPRAHIPQVTENNADEQCVTSSDAVKGEPMDLDTYHGEAGGAGEAGGVEEVDGNDEMMEFALRRLERFFGIDRTQAYNAWVNPSSYAETVKFDELKSNGFEFDEVKPDEFELDEVAQEDDEPNPNGFDEVEGDVKLEEVQFEIRIEDDGFDDMCQSNVVDSNTNDGNVEDTVIQIRSALDTLETNFKAYSGRCEWSFGIIRDELDYGGTMQAALNREQVLVGATKSYSYSQDNEVTKIILHDED